MDFIYKKLGIAEHEVARVNISWLLRLFYQIGFVVSWTIITALFVEKFGISQLPILFLIDAGLFLFGTLVTSFYFRNLEADKYLLLFSGLTLISLGLTSYFDVTEIGFFVFALLAKDLFFSRINLGLLRQTEELFSPLEARKFIPIIDSAITIGTVLGAFLLIQLLHFSCDEAVLGIWAGAVIGVIVLTILLPKILNFLPRFEAVCAIRSSRRNTFIETFNALNDRPFLKNLLLLVFFQTVLFTFVEIEFTREIHNEIQEHHETHSEPVVHGQDLQASLLSSAKEKFTEVRHTAQEKASEIVHYLEHDVITHEKLAHDLGMFHLIFGLIALAFELLITSRVLYRVGVVGSILTYLGIIFIAIMFMFFRIGNIQTLRGLQHGLHSLGSSPYHIAFYALFSRRREAIRLFFEGILVPLSVIVAIGILFFIPESYVLPVMLIATLGAICAGSFMKRNFTRNSAINMQNESGISEKLHHIEILGQRGHKNAGMILVQELKNRSNHMVIREKIIKTITFINDPEVIHAYVEIIMDTKESKEIKGKVLNSILLLSSLNSYWKNHAFGQHHLINALKNLHKTEDETHLKKLIIMNIFLQLPPTEVVPFFLEVMKTRDEQLKSICLRSCTVFNDPDIVFYLRPYLMHSNPRIRGHAVIALWKFEKKDSLKNILRELLMDNDEKVKIAGIYAIGETYDDFCKDDLLSALANERKKENRLHLLIALAKLKDKDVIPELLDMILGDDIELANMANHMLERVPKEIRDEIRREIQFEISHRVSQIIEPQNIRHMEDLQKLSVPVLEYLKRLYQLDGKYDDMLMMESVTPKIDLH